jgi:ketosteroid isomerase-like protein
MPGIARSGRSLRSRYPQAVALISLAVLCLGGFARAETPANPGHLPPDVVRANEEIDQKFIEAHRVLDTDMIMRLFTSSPDIFFVGPTGILYQGRAEVRQSIEKFFTRVITMTGVIDHVTYLPAGNGVIAYGQVTYHRHLKGQPPDTRVVVWTDYRRKEHGRWVLVFRHAHWPLASNRLPCNGAPPAAKTAK